MKTEHTKRVSMQSVADAAGVARSTVSFVLNGKEKEGRISPEVANRIRMIAKKMNYQVNEVARSLRTGHSQTIALVVANISDIFFGHLAYCFQEYAEKKGYTVIIFNTGEKRERLNTVFNLLRQRQIDGIIMVPIANIEEGTIEELNPDIPMVIIDRYFETMNTSRVIIDNYGISKMATQLLLGRGCRKIVLITFREQLMHMQDRKRGYIDALADNNAVDNRLICEVDYQEYKDEITNFLVGVFNEISDIDGVFVTTSYLSPVVIKCLVNMGLKLQSDIQLICFGRTDVAVGVSIPYVKQPIEEICKKSFDILMEQIKSPNDNRLVDCILPASIVTNYL